jgi:tRNA uridine 5-carbamoylmethylation protein Kti12
VCTDNVDHLDIWNEHSFREGRKLALSALDGLLQLHNNGHVGPCTESNAQVEPVSTACTYDCSKSRTIVLVDDIMYLRSMRKKVFHMCQLYRAPLLTVYVSADLATALLRNSTRIGDAYVQEETIRRIATDFEVPDSLYATDRHTVTYDASSSTSFAHLIENIRQVLSDTVRYTPVIVADDNEQTASSSEISESEIANYMAGLDQFYRKVSNCNKLLIHYPILTATLISSHTH